MSGERHRLPITKKSVPPGKQRGPFHVSETRASHCLWNIQCVMHGSLLQIIHNDSSCHLSMHPSFLLGNSALIPFPFYSLHSAYPLSSLTHNVSPLPLPSYMLTARPLTEECRLLHVLALFIACPSLRALCIVYFSPVSYGFRSLVVKPCDQLTCNFARLLSLRPVFFLPTPSCK